MSQSAGSSSSARSILKQQMEATSQRLDHLIQSGAFKDHHFSRKPRHGIQRYLNMWEKRNEHLQIMTSNVSYLDLKQLKKSRNLPYQNDDNLASYPVIPSTVFDHPHALKDHHGMILAYRFRVPTEHITTLEESQPLLPARPILPNARGNFLHRHYAIWADYSKTILQSSEYRRDHPQSQQWLQTNQPLFKYLSNTLRMLDPEMYVKFTSVDRYLPPDFQRMAGAWHGVAINENMQPNATRAETHIDWQDYYRAYNAVVPWGTFTGGHVVLWQPKVVYELRPGDCLFFMGGIMAHQISPVTSGVRNSLDLFTHKSSFDWKKREDRANGIVHEY